MTKAPGRSRSWRCSACRTSTSSRGEPDVHRWKVRLCPACYKTKYPSEDKVRRRMIRQRRSDSALRRLQQQKELPRDFYAEDDVRQQEDARWGLCDELEQIYDEEGEE